MIKMLRKLVREQLGSSILYERGLLQFCRGIISRFYAVIAQTSLPVGSKFRVAFQRKRGVKIGKKVFIGGNCVLDRMRPDLITIKDWVSLAGDVTILTHSIPNLPLIRILGKSSVKIEPVKLGTGAWIGYGVIILPGVKIGKFSIISAGSIVSNDIPPLTIAAGFPARPIKKIEPKFKK